MVVVSGRPLIIDPTAAGHDRRAGGCLAAGERGRGRGRHAVRATPFTGKLPMTWPRTLAQEPINVGDANYDPLYPYGYGLKTTH